MSVFTATDLHTAHTEEGVSLCFYVQGGGSLSEAFKQQEEERRLAGGLARGGSVACGVGRGLAEGRPAGAQGWWWSHTLGCQVQVHSATDSVSACLGLGSHVTGPSESR